MMLMITALNSQPVKPNRELLETSPTDLSVCPEKAKAAEFLRLMEGWL